MSAGQIDTRGFRSFPDSWSRDCFSKACKVEVYTVSGWIEIPTADVETQLTKGDTVAIKRLTRVEYPTEWDGVSVSDLVGEQRVDFVPCRVSFRNTRSDDHTRNSFAGWNVVHGGYIGGYGGTSSDMTNKFYVYDVSELFEYVPISAEYSGSFQFQTVLNDIQAAINDYREIDVSVGFVEETAETLGVTDVSGIRGPDILSSGQTFVEDKHTVVDVVNWIQKELNKKLYVRPITTTSNTVGGVELLDRDRLQNTVEDIDIIDNSALLEIETTNTVKVISQKTNQFIEEGINPSEDSYFGRELFPENKDYAIAKATYDKAVEAAGNEFGPPTIQSDSRSIASVQSEAVTELLDRLDNEAVGDVLSYGNPQVAPFTQVAVADQCGGNVFDYEVEEVVHKSAGTSSYQMNMSVSPAITEDDITVVTQQTDERILEP